MKKFLIQTTVLTTASMLLTSCFDELKQVITGEEPEAPAEQSAPATPPAPVLPEQPGNEEISRLLVEQLSGCDYATAGTLTCSDIQKNADSSVNMSAQLKMVVKEDLFTKELAPAIFNKEREAINEAANAAMKPESVYLFQVGATTDLIKDEDRTAKPLPENLQVAADELKELASEPVFRKVISAGEEVDTSATFTAAYVDGAWKFSNIVVNNAALLALNDYTAQSALPQGANILSPEFEETRKNTIREKVTAFNQLTEPYIKSREEAARARLTEYQAKAEEEARRITEQAAAEEAARQAHISTITKAMAENNLFAGEWTRDNRYGEISLHIHTASTHNSSIQFSGVLFDTQLPDASLDITGRCEFATDENGAASVIITIYEGQYDIDKPTAEVYDSKDGMLNMKLTKDGRLIGEMSCSAWANSPEKAFKVELSPQGPMSKKKKSRRR